jgi:hypothetical protein
VDVAGVPDKALKELTRVLLADRRLRHLHNVANVSDQLMAVEGGRPFIDGRVAEDLCERLVALRVRRHAAARNASRTPWKRSCEHNRALDRVEQAEQSRSGSYSVIDIGLVLLLADRIDPINPTVNLPVQGSQLRYAVGNEHARGRKKTNRQR